VALGLQARAASHSQHVLLGEDRNGLPGCCCERKQYRGRSLMCRQRALKNHGLIDDAAAPKAYMTQPRPRRITRRALRSQSQRSSSHGSGHRQRCCLLGCAQNQRRSSRTISSSARAIAMMPAQKCGQPSSCRPRIQIRRTDTLESINDKEQRHKGPKTFSFSKY
jgi:hypothetical protein